MWSFIILVKFAFSIYYLQGWLFIYLNWLILWKKICDHQGWVTSYFPWIIPLIEHAYYWSKYVGSHKPHNLFYHSFGIQILFHVIKSLPPLLYPMVHFLFIIRTMIICSYSAARIVSSFRNRLLIRLLFFNFHIIYIP